MKNKSYRWRSQIWLCHKFKRKLTIKVKAWYYQDLLSSLNLLIYRASSTSWCLTPKVNRQANRNQHSSSSLINTAIPYCKLSKSMKKLGKIKNKYLISVWSGQKFKDKSESKSHIKSNNLAPNNNYRAKIRFINAKIKILKSSTASTKI